MTQNNTQILSNTRPSQNAFSSYMRYKPLHQTTKETSRPSRTPPHIDRLAGGLLGLLLCQALRRGPRALRAPRGEHALQPELERHLCEPDRQTLFDPLFCALNLQNRIEHYEILRIRAPQDTSTMAFPAFPIRVDCRWGRTSTSRRRTRSSTSPRTSRPSRWGARARNSAGRDRGRSSA